MNLTSLNYHDLAWVLRRTPKKLLQILQNHPRRLFIAGGFIRACVAREHVSDIDVFAPTKEEALSAAKELVGEGKEERIHESENAYTVRGFSLPIQFIHRWTFEKPEDCIASFDFTVAMALFYCESHTPGSEDPLVKEETKWTSVCDLRFYQDLAAKRLVYTLPVRNEDPGGSILRVLKFYQRGYLIPLDSFGKTIARMVKSVRFTGESSIGLDNEGRPADERALARVLTARLREVDPLLDPSHIAHLPSQEEDEESEEEQPSQ